MKNARIILPAFAAVALIALPAFAYANGDQGTVSGTVASETMVAFPLQGTGVFIGAGGSTLVRGATVESVSGSTITAQSSWGSAVLNWTVNTSGAKFYDSRVASSSLSAISAGDTVSFAGTINQSQAAFTLNATAVRDWSKTTPVATSTPVHPFPHPFFPVRIWDSIKANFGFGKK